MAHGREDGKVNRRVFWGVFAVTQLVGALGLATGSPHGNPFGLVAMLIFWFPGSILGFWTLDKLGIQFGYVSILVSSFLFNTVCWYVLALAITRIRSQKSNGSRPSRRSA